MKNRRTRKPLQNRKSALLSLRVPALRVRSSAVQSAALCRGKSSTITTQPRSNEQAHLRRHQRLVYQFKYRQLDRYLLARLQTGSRYHHRGHDHQLVRSDELQRSFRLRLCRYHRRIYSYKLPCHRGCISTQLQGLGHVLRRQDLRRHHRRR